MARFDIYEDALKDVDYLIDVQANFHDHLRTRIVVPLKTREQLGEPISRLYVPMTVRAHEYYAVISLLTVIPASQLGKRVASAANQSHEVTSAIDFLLQGF